MANDDLIPVATRIRDAFKYDPGHSDLDNEQPIHITVTLGDWRELDYWLNKLAYERSQRDDINGGTK